MVWSGDGAGFSVLTAAGSPTESALPQPTVAKHVTSLSPPRADTCTQVIHFYGGCHRDDFSLKVHSCCRLLEPSLRLSAEPPIAAANVMIDHMIGVTQAAVENRPAQRSRRRGKADDQSVLFDANGKR